MSVPAPPISYGSKILLLALAYFLAGKLGLLLPYVGSHITLIWLPTGIAIAALMRWGGAVWPGIFLGALTVNLAIGSSLWLAVAIALGNTLAPWSSARLLEWLKFHPGLDRAQDILWLALAAAGGMAISASGGLTSLYAFGLLSPDKALSAWFTWWAGDFVGVLLAAPLLLNISQETLRQVWEMRGEYLSWLGATCILGWAVFFLNNDAAGHSLPLVFLMLPMVVWAAMRFEITGASIGVLLPAVIAALATSLGLGPFHQDDTHQGLLLLWLFLSTSVLILLMVTALQTQRKRAEAHTRSLAFFDPLTQLPNRRLLLDRLQHALIACVRNGQHGALMFLDLDHFKNLNDTHGHDAGDQLLKEVARRLVLCVRQGDTVARLGGDEFVVMLENLEADVVLAAKQAETVADKIRLTLAEPYPLALGLGAESHARIQHHLTTSIGISLFHDHNDKQEELLKRADLTLYQAKSAGRNSIRFFDPAMQRAVEARTALEADLRQALAHGELRLYHQLQVDGAGRPIGSETLLRWAHPQRGLVSPLEFIPLAEESGLILPMGRWVLEQACLCLAAWRDDTRTATLTVAVNVSARQFHEADFVEQVRISLENAGVNPALLKLELTESIVLTDVSDAIAKMLSLKALGVALSLDDFGTGYSSLSYLHRLPLDQLKIDQSFVRDLHQDTHDAAIVRAIITLGSTLGMAVIAEGVETDTQRDYLAAHGCQAFQGYLFGRPEPLAVFEESLRTNR